MTPSKTPQLADRTAKQPAKPKADPNDKKLITDERARREKLEKMHTLLIGYHVYRRQLNQGIATDMDDTAISYVLDTMSRMNTRDPFEEMLVIQALWSHARLARLHGIANQQTNPDHLQIVHAACDGAANTARVETASRRSSKPTSPSSRSYRMEKMENCQNRNRQTNKDRNPPRPRRYRLTTSGLESLRESARRVKPWERSTGPKTLEGKTRSKVNASKHGFRSAKEIDARRESMMLLRIFRHEANAEETHVTEPDGAGTPAGWLERIATELGGIM